jgi:uncharacterized integral membrane protein
MKNQWRVIVGILLILVIVLFAVANNMTVPINFGFTTIQSPLILVIIGSALLGALILLLVSTSAMFRQKKELKQLRKELSDYRTNNEKVLQDEREVLEREYTNKQAELAARQQQLDDQEAQLSSRAAGASTPPTIDEEMKSFESHSTGARRGGAGGVGTGGRTTDHLGGETRRAADDDAAARRTPKVGSSPSRPRLVPPEVAAGCRGGAAPSERPPVPDPSGA